MARPPALSVATEVEGGHTPPALRESPTEF
jgi:hypothetical protein